MHEDIGIDVKKAKDFEHHRHRDDAAADAEQTGEEPGERAGDHQGDNRGDQERGIDVHVLSLSENSQAKTSVAGHSSGEAEERAPAVKASGHAGIGVSDDSA